MRRCIVHFGLHKTGSSSIQRFLRRELSDPDFFYPESGHEPHLLDDCHNRILIAAFRDSPEKYHAHAKEGVSRATLRGRGQLFKTQLANWSQEEGARTLILSAEELSNFEFGELRAMTQFLGGLPCEISGIVYVRKYKRLQESRFQQALRVPGQKRKLLPLEAIHFARFPYRIKIEKFLHILGHDAVAVSKFDPQNLEAGCIVRDFCKKVGIAQESTATVRANESLTLDAVRFLYTYRKFNKGTPLQMDALLGDQLLSRKLAELRGPRAAFHSTLLAQSAHHWREDVDWVSDFLGEEMLGDIFADDDKPCIRSEADLLCFSHNSLEWLARETHLAPSKLKNATPEAVAKAVVVLQEKIWGDFHGQRASMTQAKGYLYRFFESSWKRARSLWRLNSLS